MPLSIKDFPANPECGGTQWSVADEDFLATLVGTVLIGRAQHAVSVLQGVQHVPAQTSAGLKARIKSQLITSPGAATWHRDGLIFEILCWIVAHKTAEPNDVISDPHLVSTQQGVDTLSLTFDPVSRNVTSATIGEQKCTENARDKFRDEVLPAFRQWVAGSRDNQLTSIAAALLAQFSLSDDEHRKVFDTLVQARPLKFQVSLTVDPVPFETAKCVALFAGYQTVSNALSSRFGNTFPLSDIRAWFEAFAQKVWLKVDASNV